MKGKRVAWVVAVLLLAVLAASCGSKDLVSLARLDKGGISVRDRFGNQVTVPNPDEFRKALREAKKVSDPKDQGKTTRTDYVIVGDQGMVSYDWEGKYLVYTDSSQKRQVYQADLSSLISRLAGLPPRIVTGENLDPKLSPGFKALSKTSAPWAAAFSTGGGQVVMVTAGKMPSSGYSLELEKAELGQNGNLVLTVRLEAASGTSGTAASYPYLEIAVDSTAELDIRMLSTGSSGEKVEHVILTQVEDGQSIVPVRPERGSLVLERLTAAFFVKSADAAPTVEVMVEDGHFVLGKRTVKGTAPSSDWTYFEVEMDLQAPTNPYGAVVYRSTIDSAPVEVIVPITFSGK